MQPKSPTGPCRHVAFPLVISQPRPAAAAFLAVAALSVPVTAATSSTAEAAPSYHYKNCTALHKAFKHGVGKNNAKDRTSGKPVTTFKRSTTIYNKAFAYNRNL